MCTALYEKLKGFSFKEVCNLEERMETKKNKYVNLTNEL